MLLQMALFHFYWLSSIPLCIYYFVYIFFIHSSVVEHLGCFYVLAIVNIAAMNIGGACIFLNSYLLPIYGQEWVLLDHMTTLFFSLLRNLSTIFHRGHINLHSTNSIRRVGEGISWSSSVCRFGGQWKRMAFFVGITADSGRQGSKKVSPESRTDFDRFADEGLVLSSRTESWLFLSSWVWFIMWTSKSSAVFPSPPFFLNYFVFFNCSFWVFTDCCIWAVLVCEVWLNCRALSHGLRSG